MSQLKQQYYECHITVDEPDAEKARRAVEEIGWSYSNITDDIVLGKGPKAYATKHFNFLKLDAVGVIERLNHAALELEAAGLNVIRRKVELVIYDVKEK